MASTNGWMKTFKDSFDNEIYWGVGLYD